MPIRHLIALAFLPATLGAISCRRPSEPDLAGAWRSTVAFEDGAFAAVKDLEFLYAFNAGGTMTESSNYDAVPPVAPAYGIWRRTAPHEFEAVYTWFTTQPPAKFEEIARGEGWLPTGRGVLTERITLDAAGGAYRSTITLEMFDKTGKPVAGGGRAVARGTRMTF